MNHDTKLVRYPKPQDPDTLTLDIARDFPYDYSLLMENLLDVGHVHFTHHGTISRRDKAPVVTLEVSERSKAGFSGRNLDGSIGCVRGRRRRRRW